MAESRAIRAGFVLPAATLCQREIVRFFRQRGRVIGALATPLIFWLFLGSGFGATFRAPGAAGGGYLEFSYPGTIVLIILFTAIFSSISTIEDRREGFLQSVLVAPVPRASIVMGKVLGATALSMIQGLAFLLLAPTVGLRPGPLAIAEAAGILFLMSFGLSALGFFFAWRTDSVQGFHAIMNLVLMPMWLLSGALFPAEGAPLWLRIVMYANPLTHGLDLLRRVLGAAGAGGGPSVAISAAVVIAFPVVFFAAAVAIARAPRAEAQP